ncbi:SPOR domain-containing protein [Shinella daejeonensis]|uniref:SPOR domain-containing protein n=1 Tax=Shinella daejeonensis TaxID=659017 RepID=UPI0020C76231|nr:SPOR domain-containing protein [Shinella daejeonensis]MCP8895442.1 SPOR domain-containing protein [Shinella daejeonensis]
MADKNFARSGTGNAGILADDDPLSELARLVGHDVLPVQPVVRHPSVAAGAPVAGQGNPVLALEDELLRAFDLYDAPRHVPAEPVEPELSQAEPVSSWPEPELADPVPVRPEAAPAAPAVEPAGTVFGANDDPSLEGDLLADEAEASLYDAPSVDAVWQEEPPQTGNRSEPLFDLPVQETPAPFVEPAPEAQPAQQEAPVFLGLQPVDAETAAPDGATDFSAPDVDLERELELSIGDDFEVSDTAHFVEPALLAEAGPVAAAYEPVPEVLSSPEMAAPPFAADSGYAKAEPRFVEEMPFDTPEAHAREMAEAEARWQDADDAGDPSFHAEQAYDVAPVAASLAVEDDLLAEVERYPVPEARPQSVATPLLVEPAAPRDAPPASPIFSRATPVANRSVERKEPAAAPASVAPETVGTAMQPPLAPAAEPEIEIDAFELDLSDIEFDLEAPAAVPAEPVRADAVHTPEPVVRREPAVAVPVAAYMAPTQQPEAGDGELPFDPTMIAETDETMVPVTDLDVPQLPVIEKEKPRAQDADYDFDIDAEMAQLFAAPEAPKAAGTEPAAEGPTAPVIAEVDDFERALEEDFRRSLNQPERTAIPVDPGQPGTHYTGDGYAEDQPRSRRGLLLAASVAVLAVLAGGGVYALMSGGGGVSGSGEPRVILADKDPVKIVPEERGGKTVPNQDKAVYDRVAGDSDATPQQEQLVTSTEVPVDVVQRTLSPEALPFDGPDDLEALASDDNERLLPGVDEPETALSRTDAEQSPLVSPRRVKTMIVKPDGTLVAREDPVEEPQLADGGEAAADEPPRDMQVAAQGASPRSTLAEPASTDEIAPVRTVQTTAIGANDVAAASGDRAPIPNTRPTDQPVNVVGTVTQRGNVTGTETAAAAPADTAQPEPPVANPGGYVIQIASLPSEAEAKKSYDTLSARYAGVIGGRGVDIRKAEIANRGTYYRVRIPAGSREEANVLCERYKGAGGSCLVTR